MFPFYADVEDAKDNNKKKYIFVLKKYVSITVCDFQMVSFSAVKYLHQNMYFFYL